MSDNGNVTSLMERFGVQPPAEQLARQAPSEKADYRAAVPYLEGEERYFLTAYMSNGDERDVSYGYLVEIISVAPEYLSFVYTNGVLFLHGENVRALRKLLKERAVSELHSFDPARHNTPEAGAVIIDALEWRSRSDLLAESNR